MDTEQRAVDPETSPRAHRRWAVRLREDRLVAGLATGLGERWGIPVPYLRAAFVVAAFAGGAGIVVYLIGWAFTLERPDDAPEPESISPSQKIGLGLIYAGSLLALRSVGLWFSDQVTFSAALVAFGVAAMWDRSDPTARNRIARLTTSGRDEVTRIRVIAGGLLMLAGFFYFVGSIDALSDIGPVLLAIAMTVTGFMIVFGPLVWRMAGDLANERRGRIRSDERAAMAAHLHDSVLQTLALIQRTDDPKRMITLARGQERELRDWLYRSEEATSSDKLGEAMRKHAARVESGHDLPIEIVVVGDAPMTDGLQALSQAAGEAMTNAAKHSGAARISVYVEIAADAAEVYVGDTGRGFDPAAVAPGHRGISDSIIDRMQRHGGEARIESAPGEGTEIYLRMPRTS